ncbi:Glutamate/glutamine/aspartate/asparagine transport system permease protein bztB, partial [hydrothermal vent metagenome]
MSISAVDPSAGHFRIGMLLTDTRYRSYTIQIIALFVLMLIFAWLLSNVVANFERLGKTFSFSFLLDPASYDINQTLWFNYTSRSPHWMAAVVGIANTLLVAFLGCITATILGVVAGVLRLSKNWVVAKLMTVYIEVIRNIPVLIQILIVAAVINEALPAPNDFRGADAEATASFGGALVLTNRGFYLASPIYESGFLNVFIVFLAAVVASVLFGRWAHKRQERTGDILPSFWIRLGIIVVPTLIIFYAMGAPLSWEFPELKGFNFQGGMFARDSLIALWFALSLYTGAFIAENVRAGIQAVSHGQTEAAYALGLRPGRTMQLIVLPQALRVIIPPLISQYLNLTKNSSLAIAV